MRTRTDCGAPITAATPGTLEDEANEPASEPAFEPDKYRQIWYAKRKERKPAKEQD
jgi:hypothetical protein